MKRNHVQFQKGLSLNEFLKHYGTEELCFDALFKWRWPNGFKCPNCGYHKSCHRVGAAMRAGRGITALRNPQFQRFAQRT